MKRLKLLPTIALPMFVINGAALAQPGPGAGRGWGYDNMMSWGGGWASMVLGPIMMIVILILVIVIAVTVLRWLGVVAPAGSQARGEETALQILEKRLARGNSSGLFSESVWWSI